MNKACVRLSNTENGIVVELNPFSKQSQNDMTGIGKPRFRVLVKDNTQRTIIDKVISSEYGYGECQLTYDKKKWFLLLTYSFTPKEQELDLNKILGVDLGECVAVFASVYKEYGYLRIEGGEVTQFARKNEARIRSLQKQTPFCGEGRKGHGIKTRVSNVYQAKDCVANFRNTINHRYSKALVEFAVKKGCGVIQMENLMGIKDDTEHPKFLRHWTYYDLQTKIESKAKEKGITVRKLDPSYTSQRCSRCGHISRANRKTQAEFVCTNCKYSANADYNASQNLAIKDIDKIIKKEISAKTE